MNHTFGYRWERAPPCMDQPPHRIRMYAIYGNIYHQNTPNVGMVYMDRMGTINGFFLKHVRLVRSPCHRLRVLSSSWFFSSLFDSVRVRFPAWHAILRLAQFCGETGNPVIILLFVWENIARIYSIPLQSQDIQDSPRIQSRSRSFGFQVSSAPLKRLESLWNSVDVFFSLDKSKLSLSPLLHGFRKGLKSSWVVPIILI